MNSIRAAAIAVVAIVCAVLLLVFEAIAGRIVASRHYVALPKDLVAFYQKHYVELNHLRSPYLEGNAADVLKTPESLMFTVIGHGPRTVLVQGDSWAEQFAYSAPTRQVLEAFAAQGGYTFVLAGTTSYSPSPMTAQLRVLRTAFGVKAGQVIAVIDQTDIGDELCRYRGQRQYVDGKLVIRPFPFGSPEVYSLAKAFAQQNIVDAQQWALVKLARLARIRIEAMFDSQGSTPKCGWSAIAQPLRDGLSAQDRQYFLSVVAEYIDQVFSAPETTRLMFVTHPHRLHQTGEYRLDVTDLLRQAVSQSAHRARITLLAFPPVPAAEASIYRDGDPASHLSDEAHAKHYVPPILQRLSAH